VIRAFECHVLNNPNFLNVLQKYISSADVSDGLGAPIELEASNSLLLTAAICIAIGSQPCSFRERAFICLSNLLVTISDFTTKILKNEVPTTIAASFNIDDNAALLSTCIPYIVENLIFGRVLVLDDDKRNSMDEASVHNFKAMIDNGLVVLSFEIPRLMFSDGRDFLGIDVDKTCFSLPRRKAILTAGIVGLAYAHYHPWCKYLYDQVEQGLMKYVLSVIDIDMDDDDWSPSLVKEYQITQVHAAISFVKLVRGLGGVDTSYDAVECVATSMTNGKRWTGIIVNYAQYVMEDCGSDEESTTTPGEIKDIFQHGWTWNSLVVDDDRKQIASSFLTDVETVPMLEHCLDYWKMVHNDKEKSSKLSKSDFEWCLSSNMIMLCLLQECDKIVEAYELMKIQGRGKSANVLV
jgi:hypothetical protein